MNVSVIIPTLDSKKANSTMQSVAEQQFDGEIEIIIIGDSDLNVAEARNKGVRQADYEIIAFTDDDATPLDGWISNALPHFENENVVGVEGETFGGLERINDWGYMTVNIFYRKSVFEKVGGLDTRLAGWREDTDLGWRIEKEIGEIVYEPDCLVCHPEKPRSKAIEENEKLFYEKHPKKYRELDVGNTVEFNVTE